MLLLSVNVRVEHCGAAGCGCADEDGTEGGRGGCIGSEDGHNSADSPVEAEPTKFGGVDGIWYDYCVTYYRFRTIP